ncbi:MAG: hypothetical protein K6G91_13480 [Kiritimatiellae bacterium]|nr:hypothetical protein [Kiritimatiellia bacterium]
MKLKNMVKYKHMRILVLSMLLPFAAGAARVEFPALPAPEFADTECETNVVFCAGATKDNQWEFSIELDATSGNCVEVVFGTDADGDGTLGIEEGELSVGWECGEWFLRDRRTNEMRRERSEPGRRRLEWTVFLDSQRRVRGWKENVFGGLPPLHCFSPTWNMARISASGLDPSNEAVESRVSAQGFIVRVR